jgi:hypothetical protein
LPRKRCGLPRASLQEPGQSDLRRIHIPAGKNALPCVERDVDHCPITMQLEKPAAVDGPQEAGVAGMVERPFGRTTEQSHGIPAESGGTLGPVFRRVQEALTVFNELAPTVPRNVTGRTIRIKPGNTLDPISGKLRLRCCFFLVGLLIQLWQLPQPVTASSKSGPKRPYAKGFLRALENLR